MQFVDCLDKWHIVTAFPDKHTASMCDRRTSITTRNLPISYCNWQLPVKVGTRNWQLYLSGVLGTSTLAELWTRLFFVTNMKPFTLRVVLSLCTSLANWAFGNVPDIRCWEYLCGPINITQNGDKIKSKLDSEYHQWQSLQKPRF